MEEVVRVFVSTERLGSPHGLAAQLLGLEHPVDDGRPTATCHLQVMEEENALCGYEWEGLTRVPGDPSWTDVHPELRCDTCSIAVGVRDEDPEGRSYLFSL